MVASLKTWLGKHIFAVQIGIFAVMVIPAVLLYPVAGGAAGVVYGLLGVVVLANLVMVWIG